MNIILAVYLMLCALFSSIRYSVHFFICMLHISKILHYKMCILGNSELLAVLAIYPKAWFSTPNHAAELYFHCQALNCSLYSLATATTSSACLVPWELDPAIGTLT